MARIQFELPERFLFATDVLIYASHVNKAGHVDNAQLLSLVSEARTRFYLWLGHEDTNVEGLSFFVDDIVAQYRSEAFYGETLRIELVPCDFSRCGFDLVFRVTETRSGREVARGKIGQVCVDPATRKATPIPEPIRAQLAAA